MLKGRISIAHNLDTEICAKAGILVLVTNDFYYNKEEP
jgi:hypothetical protein